MKKYVRILMALMAVGLFAAGCSTTTTPQEEEVVNEETPQETPEEETPTVEVEYRNIDLQALIDEGKTITEATVYGIYSQEGDAVDSAIRTTVYTDEDNNVVLINFDEALIPYSSSGATGWAVVDEDTAALLGDAVLETEIGTYAKSFTLGDVTWTGELVDGNIVYQGSVNGTTVSLMDYLATQEGGEWYYTAKEAPAQLLNDAGEAVKEVTIETKASIEHGVDFWPSEITFPGNVELIKNYVYDHGVNYGYYPDSTDIAKNENGQWVVADTVSGTTLAGAPNYFNLIKEAYDKIEVGEGTLVE